MKFEEWKAKHYPNINLGGYSISKKAWDAAIDEAVNIAREGAFYTAVGTADHIASKIKELKG